MKIAVLGAGAMGGIVAIGLHRGGEDVTIIDPWKAHAEAIRTTGFQITGFYGGERSEWKGVNTGSPHRRAGPDRRPAGCSVPVSQRLQHPAHVRAHRATPGKGRDGGVGSERHQRAYHCGGCRAAAHHRLRDTNGRPDLGAGTYPPYPGGQRWLDGLHDR